MGKKGGAKAAAAPAAGGDAAGRKCGTCGETKGKDAYTGGQWKKTERMCKACQEEEEALLAPTVEKMEQEKQAQKEAKEREERERAERLKQEPTSEKAKARRREVAMNKVMQAASKAEQAPPLEVTKEEVLEFASQMGFEISAETSVTDAINTLTVYAHQEFIRKPSADRALSYPYTNSLETEDLHALAAEMDILEAGKLTRAELTEQMREQARKRNNQRMCEMCGKMCTKADFNQSQWAKESSKCLNCCKQLEQEKRFFEEYTRMYGHPPVFDDDDVYTSQENLYETLKVETNATEEEIKKSYRTLAIKFHPDRWAHASAEKRQESEEAFKLITEAYETLSDADRKKQYDKEMRKREAKKKKREAKQAAKANMESEA